MSPDNTNSAANPSKSNDATSMGAPQTFGIAAVAAVAAFFGAGL